MNCAEARHNWMLYLDSEGDPQLHLRIRDHVGECPDCSRWFSEQQQIEQRMNGVLSEGEPTFDLWQRVLSNAGVIPPATQRRRWLVLAATLSAAAVLLPLAIAFQIRHRSDPTEMARLAADWHEQWRRGDVHPDLESSSDVEVDRYLKARVPFRVHCPPRTDVQFSVQGAGVCSMKNQRQAAYIVGRVGASPVSILVLDRASVDVIPPSGFQLRQEGSYRVASKVIAENLVIVTGKTSPDLLERLLNAYGSYHEG